MSLIARVQRWPAALKFVVLVGIMSLFADFVYEGARSIVGPYLSLLGAGAFVVAAVSGFGELCGYGLRIFSGRVSDRTGKFWPITIIGYVVQMASVPLLAIAGTWQIAACFVVLERIGKATRNPPRDVMLSHAASEIGYGFAFGLHEALDQGGAMFGPLVMAGILAWSAGGYRLAFAVLAIPALIMLSLLGLARYLYPAPHKLAKQASEPEHQQRGFSRAFWLYVVAAALIGAGYADYPLIAFHFHKQAVVQAAWIPILYAIAMACAGGGSYIFGRLYDRVGMGVLVPITVISALFAPLVFRGGFVLALLGMVLWGLGMGAHESVMQAAVATMVPRARRASAYGTFTATYGVAWFLGSAALGGLYGVSITWLIAFSVLLQLLAVPLLLAVSRSPHRPAAT